METYEIVPYDPGNESTFPSVCPTPEDVRRRFGFVGGERLLFTEAGAYVGQIVRELPQTTADLVGDPLCTCGHRLGMHEEEDGPGHAGCRADVPIDDADSSKGDAVYEQCPCPGFISAELEQESSGIAADYANSAE